MEVSPREPDASKELADLEDLKSQKPCTPNL